MSLVKSRRLGVIRSTNVLSKSLVHESPSPDTQDKIQTMKVKGDSFGIVPYDKKEFKSKEPSADRILSEYECRLLSEIERLNITVLEMQAKLQDKTRMLAEVQKKRNDESLRHQKKVEELYAEHSSTKEELSRTNQVITKLNEELVRTEQESKECIESLREEMEKQKAELEEEKDSEISWRKEKMETMKKQICEALSGNSLVRQKQLDEMTKALDKVHQEADDLRFKLRHKPSSVIKSDDLSCLDCKNKTMALKLKDIEIDQLRSRLNFESIE